jgi:predicted RecB family nuclease
VEQIDGKLRLSATDLSKHLGCAHITTLDREVALRRLEGIYRNDPSIEVLKERGAKHEKAYIEHLRSKGLQVREDPANVAATVEAMEAGFDAIKQAHLGNSEWRGRADVLLKVPGESKFGLWSYEVVDTKLARETKAGTILQLCLYSELLEEIQGTLPEMMHVVSPGREFEPESFRVHDYIAYHRLVKHRLEDAVGMPIGAKMTVPDPVEHCHVCDWWSRCNEERRKADHLSFVAGISESQIKELRTRGITSLTELAHTQVPLDPRPKRGSPETYIRIREQARLQFQSPAPPRMPLYEMLPLESGFGLSRLPAPSKGDISLDFEADPFVEPQGLEYLLGYILKDEHGDESYRALWALDSKSEKENFESFVDMVMARLEEFPDLHIYHFSPYEPGALKRLMGRYGTRADEIDRLLRAGVFVDLFQIVKQSLRAGIESYSLKDLEILYRLERKTKLEDARRSLRAIEIELEMDRPDSLSPIDRDTVEQYNRDDCVSTLRLRDWLEELRRDAIAGGAAIERPKPQSGDASESVAERQEEVERLTALLLGPDRDDPGDAEREGHSKWLLANMLEFHRSEDKVSWWEYFRLAELDEEDLLLEKDAISGLTFLERFPPVGRNRASIDRYSFPAQETQIRKGETVESKDRSTGEIREIGEVAAININEATIDIKKRKAALEIHPPSVFVHDYVGKRPLTQSLFRLAGWVAANGVDMPGEHRAARDLLIGNPPRLKSGAKLPESLAGTSAVNEACTLALALDGGVLAIQGPPGSGKTHTAAHMICALVAAGRKVGITANSHKVIRKVLEKLLEVSQEKNHNVTCIQKTPDDWEETDSDSDVIMADANKDILDALSSGEAQVAGGTAWVWADESLKNAVDVLFVDEAGQMSLVDVLAVSQAGTNLVLLGDPQQLRSPLKGTHPPGTEVSALNHLLGDHDTMPADKGLFLPETWRMAPPICDFTSEVFYEGKLKPRPNLIHQRLDGSTRFDGNGLWRVEVNHEGNQSSSHEEVAVIKHIVEELVSGNVTWTDSKGTQQRLQLDDVLVVAPYNAQVFELAHALPDGARVGTVDKFQGQEAPVVIYSMATSSPEDAPRGMEFLYSGNRFNVATSRAQCACILVANPSLFEPECRSPRQIKLANALCRYVELSKSV